jgi:hypothetical protein
MKAVHPTHDVTGSTPFPMPPPKTKIRDGWVWPIDPTARPVEKPEPERAEILNVLARAAEDPAFIAQLTYSPAAALADYRLSQPARAALASGDVRWIEARTGKLDPRLRTWLDCRLQQEIW